MFRKVCRSWATLFEMAGLSRRDMVCEGDRRVSGRSTIRVVVSWRQWAEVLWAIRVVDGGVLQSWRWEWGGLRDGMSGGKNEPRQASWLVFCNALAGPPTFWVPPCMPLAPTPPSSDNEPPTSLERGGGLGAVLLRLLGPLVIGPTSLMRGEGHLVGGIPSLWMGWVARMVVQGGKANPTSTIDTVDLRFKLRSDAQ